jgi:hypothetical protein
MSSRQEEKERRKAEREALQRKEQQAAARKRRLQLASGVVLAAAAIAAVAISISSGGGSKSSSDNSPVAGDVKGITLPPRQITDLNKAAAAAGCIVRSFPIEGRNHVDGKVNYRTNPPTSGNHNPVPAQDGVYDPTNTPPKENFVHTLEHGRIEYQYGPGTPPAQVKQLEALWNEPIKGSRGYHQLLFQNNTNMPYAIAATAWGHLIGCSTFSPKLFDALRDFRDAYVDKGPELIP